MKITNWQKKTALFLTEQWNFFLKASESSSEKKVKNSKILNQRWERWVKSSDFKEAQEESLRVLPWYLHFKVGKALVKLHIHTGEENTRKREMIVERKRGLGLQGIMPTIWRGRKERSWEKSEDPTSTSTYSLMEGEKD